MFIFSRKLIGGSAQNEKKLSASEKETFWLFFSGGHCTWGSDSFHMLNSVQKKKIFIFHLIIRTHIHIHLDTFRVSVWLLLLCVYCTRMKWRVCFFLFTHTHTHTHRIYTVYFANILWTNEHMMCTVYREHCKCNATRLNVDCLRMAVFICQMSMRFCIKILINQCPLYHDKLKINNYYTITLINFVSHFSTVNLFYIKFSLNTNHFRCVASNQITF